MSEENIKRLAVLYTDSINPHSPNEKLNGVQKKMRDFYIANFCIPLIRWLSKGCYIVPKDSVQFLQSYGESSASGELGSGIKFSIETLFGQKEE